LLGNLFSIAHERGAEFRTRKLDAAVDFLDVAEALRRDLRRADKGNLDESVRAISDGWDTLVPRVTLIELLFGAWTASANEARHAGTL
jgi:hypothetical protein